MDDLSGNSVEDYLEACGELHGHICAGQVLGVRMSLHGCRLIGITEPRGADRKKIIVWVEIDRCMADAVSVVTGVSLGRRTLKYVDYGKVAATFLNLSTGQARRILALESARHLADLRHPEISEKKKRQKLTYLSADESELFKVEEVKVSVEPLDLPGHPMSRVICAVCGEGVNDGREVKTSEGQSVCRACFSGGYYVVL